MSLSEEFGAKMSEMRHDLRNAIKGLYKTIGFGNVVKLQFALGNEHFESLYGDKDGIEVNIVGIDDDGFEYEETQDLLLQDVEALYTILRILEKKTEAL